MKRRSALGVPLSVTLLGTAVFAAAGDWPNWRGANRDGTSDETGLISSWSKAGRHPLHNITVKVNE